MRDIICIFSGWLGPGARFISKLLKFSIFMVVLKVIWWAPSLGCWQNPHHKPIPESHWCDTFIQREDSRAVQKRNSKGHHPLPLPILKRVSSAWLGEVRQALPEVRRRPEEHTFAARFASLYLWGNDLLIQASALKSPAVLSCILILKFLLPFEFYQSRKLVMLHIILVSAMIIKHSPPEFFYKQ